MHFLGNTNRAPSRILLLLHITDRGPPPHLSAQLGRGSFEGGLVDVEVLKTSNRGVLVLQIPGDEVDLGCSGREVPRRRRRLLLGVLLGVEEDGNGSATFDRGTRGMTREVDEIGLMWGGHVFGHEVTSV